MKIEAFFDPATYTISYVVYDEAGKVGVVIDPVMDFDPKSGRVSDRSARKLAAFIDAQGLTIPYVLETHCHADHLTSAPWLKARYGSKTVIGAGIPTVQKTFKTVFDLESDFPTDGSQWDVLIEDGGKLHVGALTIEAIPSGGHTPASVSYLIGDAVFVGDSLFQPDQGTARCDFPGGSAAELYDSVQRLYALPDSTRVFTLHDYQPGGRQLRFVSTIGEQKAKNVHLDARTTKEEFVALRRRLEDGKEMPNLLLQSVQVNLRAGELPPPAANGIAYLKIPLNVL
ncbi:MAG: MBL fold metallo-hydrolase [Planctomycetes bacterium]|nr:MBL fold metallo-hydrolase [Planctomycetota bacterium]